MLAPSAVGFICYVIVKAQRFGKTFLLYRAEIETKNCVDLKSVYRCLEMIVPMIMPVQDVIAYLINKCLFLHFFQTI